MTDSTAPTLKTIRLLFFVALTLVYLSLTPGTIEGQGYNRENLVAANQIVTNVFHAATGQSLVRVEWTRHGFIEPLFHLPFAVVSRALPGDAVKWAGRLAVLQPILATSLLCTLLLIWAYRLTANLRLAMLLAITAGLGTMLWPYAYIGLETTQSLALLVAAYLVLCRKPTRSWPETLLVGAACAVAVAVKLNGVFLAPAVAFLILEYFGLSKPFHRKGANSTEGAQRAASLFKLIGVLTIIITVYALNHLAKSRYWNGADAGVNYFRDILVDSPLTAALQAFAFFGSPNKSLLLFCPVLSLSLLTLGSAWRRQPRLVVFALLVLSGLIGGFSMTRMWADETWGPRYLHAAIAPLMLCLAAAKSATEFHWRQELPLLVFWVVGFAVSLLGSLFPYVALHNAATKSSQATLESFQYDPNWSHIRFNWQLTKVWLQDGSQPENWPPPKHWWMMKPEDAQLEKAVDLREYVSPQPILAQHWRASVPASFRVFSFLRGLCVALLAAGIAGLILALRRATSIESELQQL